VTAQACRVIWYRFTATLRRRWSGYVTVVLLIGLVGGLAMGSVEAARRTESAFSDYLAASNASDLQMGVFPAGNQVSDIAIGSPVYRTFTNTLERLPEVERVAANPQLFALALKKDGAPELTGPLANQLVDVVGSENGLYFEQDKAVVTQGRLPNPASEDQAMASAEAAQLLHLRVGDTLRFGIYTIAQSSESDFGTPKVRPYLTVDMHLTGLVVFPNDVVQDDVDRYPAYMVFTPALTRRIQSAAYYPTYSIKLRPGTSIAKAEQALINAIPPGFLYNFHLTSVVKDEVNRSVRPEALALGVFGGIAGVAALLIAGQALARLLRSSAGELEILRAIGATRAVTLWDGLSGAVAAVLLGTLLAVVVAALLSPLSPTGAVRQVETSPGITADWTVYLVGLGVITLVLGGLAAWIALRQSPRHRRRTLAARGDERGTSPIHRLAIAVGLPVSAATGVRFALDRPRGEQGVPVRSAIVGGVLAVVVVTSTLTFANSLHTLVSTPRLYGWNWDYAIQAASQGGAVPPVARRLLNADPDVASWTGYKYADVEMDGQAEPILIPQPPTRDLPPLLAGHDVEAKDQIVLGRATLAQLHKRIGDMVVLAYGGRSGVRLAPVTLRIVGEATLPAIGNSGALHVSMGLGGLVSHSLTPASITRAQTSTDPNLNGPAIVVVRLRSGLSPGIGLTSLQKIVRETNRALASDPNASNNFAVIGVQRPAEIVNYKATGATAAVLAGGLAVAAVVGLGLTLVASVRRRRRDLAILRTLGFTRTQLASTVIWQSSVAAVAGVVAGIPLGIALGRWLWDLFAHEISAVADPTVPVSQVALVGLAALMLSTVVAVVPGRIAARTPVAVLLHAE